MFEPGRILRLRRRRLVRRSLAALRDIGNGGQRDA